MSDLENFKAMLARAGEPFKVKENRSTGSGQTFVKEYEVVIDNGGWSGATFTFGGTTGNLIHVWIGD